MADIDIIARGMAAQAKDYAEQIIVSGGVITTHNLLNGRSANDTHPISSITGLDSTLATKANQSALNVEIANRTATETEIHERIDDSNDRIDGIHDSLLTKASISEMNSALALKADKSVVNEHVTDESIHITDEERDIWNDKQDMLMPGNNITIIDNVISAIVGNENGTINHADLTNLDYENSGHTGFVSDTDSRLSDARNPLSHTHNPSDINQDSDNSFITETERTNWNNAIDNITALQSEATAKWVLLNNVEVRSRDNATNITTLQTNDVTLQTNIDNANTRIDNQNAEIIRIEGLIPEDIAGRTIQNNVGVDMPYRGTMQFVGLSVTDDAENNRTIITKIGDGETPIVGDFVERDEVLTFGNTVPFEPTTDYDPTTKAYVDKNVRDITVPSTDTMYIRPVGEQLNSLSFDKPVIETRYPVILFGTETTEITFTYVHTEIQPRRMYALSDYRVDLFVSGLTAGITYDFGMTEYANGLLLDSAVFPFTPTGLLDISCIPMWLTGNQLGNSFDLLYGQKIEVVITITPQTSVSQTINILSSPVYTSRYIRNANKLLSGLIEHWDGEKFSDVANVLVEHTNILKEKSPIINPNFSGIPTAPTAIAGTNTAQIATTQFVARDYPKSQLTAITKTVDISNLQAEIDALPKLLMADVTLTVNAGTIATAITISKFSGNGILSIYGANAANTTTHNILRMVINHCNNSRINIRGFTATATDGICFDTNNCTAPFVYYYYCNAIAGVNTTSGFIGLRAYESASHIHYATCTITNKAVVLQASRATSSVNTLSGTGNATVYNADNGIIMKYADGTITGTILNSTIRGGFITSTGGFIAQTTAISKTIDIANLQAEIDALPKLLMADVTFNVNAGTYAGGISIQRFTGNGILTINGATSLTNTHNINSLLIANSNTFEIVVRGFNITSTATLPVDVQASTGEIILNYINIISAAGLSGTGARVIGTNYVYMQNSAVSNRQTAILATRSKLVTNNLSGSNNTYVYSADSAGIIQKQNAGTLTGTNLNYYTNGGLIVNPSGGTIGT